MLDALALGKAFACLFFAVLFLQSGLDKVTDRKGNLEWLTGHFSKSPLAKLVPVMLATVTVVELAAGACCAAGAAALFVPALAGAQTLGLGLCCAALCMLFFGQRVAKDYAGAATLATYFVGALLGLVLTGVGRLG
ncbi:MAG: DoxX family protein [Armatimonadetes bacterium]|nr:DoxX family protein [Armatimonadota bacterium]